MRDRAVDSHAHVFHRGLPLVAGRRYAPAYDATLDAYIAMLDANGFVGGVLVQPSFLGTDNSFLLEAIAAMPTRLRGIAVVDPHVTRDDLDTLARAGIAGLRFNLMGLAAPDFTRDPWRGLLRNAAALGLHVEVQAEARRLDALLPQLLAAEGPPVVIDHFGLPDPAMGADDPAIAAVMRQAASSQGRCWIKLSAPYRLGPDGMAVAGALVPRLGDAFGGNRLVFGSDWPHTRFEDPAHVGAAVTALARWFPDAAERQRVALQNPAQLYGFADLASS